MTRGLAVSGTGRRILLVLGLVLSVPMLAGGPSTGWAADEEDRALLRESSPALQRALADLPPFVRDTELRLHLRTFYRNNEASPDTFQEAWVAGGWLTYRSGWLADTVAIGATEYLSLPVYAPEDRDGTLLLQKGQNTIAALGEAWAKLRLQEQVLTGGRQLIDVDYVNRQDNRMLPNTFEAAMLGGKLDWLAYNAGYVFTIKPREENTFLSMAARAGAAGADRGLVLVGVRATPWKPLAVNLSTAFGVDTFNTAFLRAEYTRPLAKGLALTVGAQYHDQRSVGEELVGSFDTWSVGAHAAIQVGGASADVMFHKTGDGADIRTPFGTWPGYLVLINKDFDRADETAWGVKVTYDFARLGLSGLSALFFFAQGTGADNRATGGPAPDRREYDVEVQYTVPKGALRGLSVRVRTALLDQQGTPGLLPDIRLIVNFPIRLL